MVNMVYFFEIDSDYKNGSMGIRFPYNFQYNDLLTSLVINLIRRNDEMECLICKSKFNLWQCENCQLAFFCSECLVKNVFKNKAQCPSCKGHDWKMIRASFPSIPLTEDNQARFYCRQCQRFQIQDKNTDSAKEKLCPTCFLYWHFKGAFG